MIAAHLDRQHLPGGSVLMDSFVGWGVWLASDDTKQFVITSDYDFVAVLNRPWDFGITCIVMRNPDGSDASDAITKRYPSPDGADTVARPRAAMHGDVSPTLDLQVQKIARNVKEPALAPVNRNRPVGVLEVRQPQHVPRGRSHLPWHSTSTSCSAARDFG